MIVSIEQNVLGRTQLPVPIRVNLAILPEIVSIDSPMMRLT